MAAILSDLSRSGFKTEFKDWLDSIPQFPKGYDFQFGDLAELLDINFATMVSTAARKRKRTGSSIGSTKTTQSAMKYQTGGTGEWVSSIHLISSMTRELGSLANHDTVWLST